MKLNRILASVTVASTLLSAGAMAADGTITFNGTVTASACTALTGVSVGGGAPAVTPCRPLLVLSIWTSLLPTNPSAPV